MSLYAQIQRERADVQEALQAEQQAAERLREAETAYDQTIEAQVAAFRAQLEREHADVTDARSAARDGYEKAQETTRYYRNGLKETLLAYSDEAPADKKPLPGLARRDYIEALVSDATRGNLIRELADNAPYLLTVDEKALNTFVKAFAADGDLPQAVSAALPSLRVVTRYQWTISNPTLLKDAD